MITVRGKSIERARYTEIHDRHLGTPDSIKDCDYCFLIDLIESGFRPDDKLDDVTIAAMAALADWHGNKRNILRKEPPYLRMIRAALENRGLMSPSGAPVYRVDFDRIVREAIEAA